MFNPCVHYSEGALIIVRLPIVRNNIVGTFIHKNSKLVML